MKKAIFVAGLCLVLLGCGVVADEAKSAKNSATASEVRAQMIKGVDDRFAGRVPQVP